MQETEEAPKAVFAKLEPQAFEPVVFRQDHKKSNACQRLFVSQFDKMLFQLYRNPKAKFSRADVLDIE